MLEEKEILESSEMMDLAKQAQKIENEVAQNPLIKKSSEFLNTVKNLFGDETKMAKLTIALNSLRERPSHEINQLMQMKLARSDYENKKQEENEELNKTVAYLKRIGRSRLAEMVLLQPSMAKSVLATLIPKEQQPIKGVVLNPGEQLINPVTGALIGEGKTVKKPTKEELGGMTKDQLRQANNLRNSLNQELKDYDVIENGWNSIRTFRDNPGAVSDYGLAVGFAKILDPGSVAREGEVAAVANSGSLTGALKSSLLNALSGTGKLPQEVRDEIVKLSQSIYQSRKTKAQKDISRYISFGEDLGIPAKAIYFGGNFPFENEQNQSQMVIPTIAKQAGITIDDWKEMTSAEKAVFLPE